LQDFILRWALARAMKKRAPDLIPRSGEAGRRADYFSVQLNDKRDDTFSILVDAVEEDGISGKCWLEDQYSSPCVVPNKNLSQFNVLAQRYYGLQTIEYNGAGALIFGEALGRPIFAFFCNEIRQFMFNSRTPKRLVRKKVLDALVNYYLQDAVGRSGFVSAEYNGVSSTKILADLYGERIWGHPIRMELLAELNLTLASLVVSGDAQEKDIKYKATPKALQTVAQFEEVERRQRTSETREWATIALTVVVAIATAIQAWAAWSGK